MIWREMQRLPAGFLEQVIEYRRYAAAKAIYDVTPTAPGLDLVKQIDFACAEEDIDRG